MFDLGQIKRVNDLKSSLIINNKTYAAVVRAEPYCTRDRVASFQERGGAKEECVKEKIFYNCND